MGIDVSLSPTVETGREVSVKGIVSYLPRPYVALLGITPVDSGINNSVE
jgi:hypothetical protein